SLVQAEHAAYPHDTSMDINFGVIMMKRVGAAFPFPGFQWTTVMIAQRVGWLIASALIVAAASFLFDRYRRENVRARCRFFVDLARLIPNLPFLRIFRAEFGLIASGASIWWYLGAAGLIIAGAFVPMDGVMKAVLPIALIWPLERMSSLGARER